ncbi:SLOG family protein [Flammeovirga kamogawensis]|uniref:DUF2493 domain-containing protein n=1 Tax=Flammeovirga kamogawensis TaxID=373891 RepID=A0ABX8H5A9_9BACT|nr:SLOG family protein [Flammeovirga kamogawensis]MBB6463847.1 hypothetical protein [Flammeovirga kamogawensis]QWG10772.1 DUF2493 domain-containing protein [Flammeovirga kamogawensis]
MEYRVNNNVSFKNKLIIAGTRSFKDHALLDSYTKEFTAVFNLYALNTELVSGGGKGADEIGEEFGRRYGFNVKRFLPDWSVGKKAGPMRNRQMAEYATHLICFWDGVSPGTKNMMQLAKRYNLTFWVINYKTLAIVNENRPLRFME